MNQLRKTVLIVIVALALFILLINLNSTVDQINGNKDQKPFLNQYCNNMDCVYTRYKIEELKDIKISSNVDLSYLKSFNITFIFIDPELSGNFTVSFLNLIIYLSKHSNIIPTCTKNVEGCKYYTNDSLDENFWLFYNNETLLINGTKVLRVYIINSTENKIEINKNYVFLKGDENGIVKVLDKFLLYWYGIISS